MLFEKVMEEGRSYLKSEMAHRGGGILGTRMHQSAPRMHAFNCAVGESEGVQARTGPGGALCAGHRGIPAPNSMQPGAERLGGKPAR